MGDRPADGQGSSGFLRPSATGSSPRTASFSDGLYGGHPPAGEAGADPASTSGFGGDESAGETGFTETTHVSWFGKMSEAIGGVLIGLLLVVVSAGVLFWNEGRAVQTSRSLSEGAGLVVDVGSERVDPAHEGRLVHLQGDLAARAPAVDPAFGVQATAARLVRHVEMYQWKEDSRTETVKQVGGGEERRTTYTYHRVWSASRNASERFHQQAGHQNPPLRFGSFEAVAPDATLGGFRPGPKALGQLAADEPFAIDPAQVSAGLAGRPGIGPVFAERGGLYLGQDSASPRIGDLRVTYRIAALGPVSFIGRQAGSGLDEYPTKAGDRLLMGRSGLASAADMFAGAQADNRTVTWILRLVGSIVMGVGFAMVLRPIAVFGDIVPIVGSVLGAGTAIAALAMTAVLAPLVVAIAWFVYRPLVSLGILAAGAALVYGLRMLSRQVRQGTRPGAAGARPMPPPLPGATTRAV